MYNDVRCTSLLVHPGKSKSKHHLIINMASNIKKNNPIHLALIRHRSQEKINILIVNFRDLKKLYISFCDKIIEK